jgi:hypothetical protein
MPATRSFIQGFATMTNGENTAFIAHSSDFLLSSRGNFEGYTGYQSDSEVFTHILHYTANPHPRDWAWRPTSTLSPPCRMDDLAKPSECATCF